MSDDRISHSPNPPSCPVCATGFSNRPGAKCPACGRVYALPNSATVPDVGRHPTNATSSRLQGTIEAVVGMLLVAGSAAFSVSNEFLGVLVPLAVLLVPAVIRTIHLAHISPAEKTGSRALLLLWSFLVSFGVASLAGIACAVAFVAICLPISLSLNRPSDGAAILAGIVGLGLFALIFYKLWPRESEYDRLRRPPDPEE